MKINNKLTLLLTLSSGFIFTKSVLADQYHYKDILVGDRAAGLAGAYTAIADDASGLYYNPAGVVYTSKPKISGSVNAYNYKTTTYKGITSSNPNQKWSRKSSGMVANYFGVVQPIGDSSIGFSIAIPNYELEDQSDSFRNLEASQRLITNGAKYKLSDGVTEETFKANASNAVKKQEIDYNNQDTTTLAGISYATPVSKDLSFGVTLYAYMRKKEQTLEQISIIQGTSTGTNAATVVKDSFYQKVQSEEFGLQPRLGLMWSPAEKISIGLMVQSTIIMSQSPKTRVNQNLCSVEGCFEYNATNDTFEEIDNTTLLTQDIGLQDSKDNELPVEINLGAAYFVSDALLYSADFGYATKTNVYESTWNIAGAAEYFLDQTWAVRGGLYTNNANTKKDVATSGNDHVDLFGGSFSVTRYTKSSNITIGLNYATGSGEANLFKGSENIQDITVNSVNLFISTSASF
jgi:long-chain fatty acid transport protein